MKYPAVFLSTGENDGLVNPMNSRKMAARLSVQIDQITDYLAFLFDQLGMTL